LYQILWPTLLQRRIVWTITNLDCASVAPGTNFFDRALANGSLKGGDDVPSVNGIDTAGTTAASALDAWAKRKKFKMTVMPTRADGNSMLKEAAEEAALDEVEVLVGENNAEGEGQKDG
jgi:coatomer protein complex subunit alpha (xenin)